MHKTLIAILASCALLSIPGCFASDHVVPAPIIGEDHSETKKDKKVLVVFGAGWCKYCQILKKDMGSLDTNGLEIQMVDVDENPELKQKNNVVSLPTSIIFLNGKETSRKTGYERKEYSKWLKQNRDKN